MDITSFVQFAGAVVSVVSAGTAVVSVVFAWKAVKTVEKSSVTSSLTELLKLYMSEPVFMAIDSAWTLYREKLYKELVKEKKDDQEILVEEIEKKASQGIPIKKDSAKEAVDDLDADLPRRKSIHLAFWFWEHLAKLVNRGLIDEELALTSFGDPAILGYLYPVDEAWVEKHGRIGDYRGYLKKLYVLWQKRKKS